MAQTGIKGNFGVGGQMLNTMASGDLDRNLRYSISLTQAPWVKRASQQHISPFAPDA